LLPLLLLLFLLLCCCSDSILDSLRLLFKNRLKVGLRIGRFASATSLTNTPGGLVFGFGLGARQAPWRQTPGFLQTKSFFAQDTFDPVEVGIVTAHPWDTLLLLFVEVRTTKLV
jgi:hypothetical protein